MRESRYPTTRMLSGGELARLLSMIVLLAVLFVFISRLRTNPNMLAWLVRPTGEDTKIAHHGASAPARAGEGSGVTAAHRGDSAAPPVAGHTEQPGTPSKPDGVPGSSARPTATPSGIQAGPAEPPLDEDPEEREAIKEEFQAVVNGRISREIIEMPAYHRLLRWVRSQSWQQLRQRAKSGYVYTDFMQSPDHFRGKLIAMKLRPAGGSLPCRRLPIRKTAHERSTCTKCGGSAPNRRLFPMCSSCRICPKACPTGPTWTKTSAWPAISSACKDTCQPTASRGAVPLRAPLFLGRLDWHESPPVMLTKTDFSLLGGIVAAAGLIAAGTVGYLFLRGRKRPSRLAGDRVAPGKIAIDDWLQHAENGPPAELDDELH